MILQHKIKRCSSYGLFSIHISPLDTKKPLPLICAQRDNGTLYRKIHYLRFLRFASEIPIAIACFVLVTTGPFFEPLRNFPSLNSSITTLILALPLDLGLGSLCLIPRFLDLFNSWINSLSSSDSFLKFFISPFRCLTTLLLHDDVLMFF